MVERQREASDGACRVLGGSDGYPTAMYRFRLVEFTRSVVLALGGAPALRVTIPVLERAAVVHYIKSPQRWGTLRLLEALPQVGD